MKKTKHHRNRSVKNPGNDVTSIKNTSSSTTKSNIKALSSSSENWPELDNDWFPWYAPWVVCAVTMTFRVWYVCQPTNWWILHPDEIFQTLEVAHSEMYGFGFRPFEYLPKGQDSPVTRMRQSEALKGMHSMRSFLLPRFFILVSWVAELVGYTGAPFLLWKLSHAVVTSCLPLAVYKLTRVLFRSRNIGVIAAILAATSTHLTVFGTHTLINSFCGTPLFFALAILFENVIYPTSKRNEIHQFTDQNEIQQSTDQRERKVSKDFTVRETVLPNQSNFWTVSNGCDTRTISNTIELKEFLKISNGTHHCDNMNGRIVNGSVHTCALKFSCIEGRNGIGIRSFGIVKEDNNNGVLRRTNMKENVGEWKTNGRIYRNVGDSGNMNSTFGEWNTNENTNGKVGECSTNDNMNGTAGEWNTNGIMNGKVGEWNTNGNMNGKVGEWSTSSMNGALGERSPSNNTNGKVSYRNTNGNIVGEWRANAKESTNHHNAFTKTRNSPGTAGIIIASAILVICCYVRVDASLFVFMTSLPHLHRGCFRMRAILPCLIGGLLGLCLCVLDDFNSYGFGTITPYHWLRFNVWQDYSAVIYGRMEWMWYARKFLFESPSLTLLTAVCLSVMVCASLNYSSLSADFSSQYRTMCKLTVTMALQMMAYSAKGHKELRFMYNFLVLMFITFAFCIFSIASYMKVTFSSKISQVFIVFSVSLFVLSQWGEFPSSTNKSLALWTYMGNTDSHEVLACFNYIRQQDDVTGVYSDKTIHMSGGYSVLHKDVPLVALGHFEFYEFSRKTRTKLQSTSYLQPKQDLHVCTFTGISEFISIHSTSYLLKYLLSKLEYNYFVMDINVQFLAVGFDEVFRSGKRKVLKRNLGGHQQKHLQEFAASFSAGNNATVLTYEGSWLMKFNQTLAAKQRFVSAISINPRFLEAYKLLARCCDELGDIKSSQEVIRKCVQIFDKHVCIEAVKPINLHETYNIGI